MKKRPDFKLVYRPGKTLTKVALLGVIVVSTVTLIALHCAIGASQDKAQALKQDALGLQQENTRLEQMNQLQDTDEGFIQAAQQQGMVDPDTTIYHFD
ncbi:MAG: hypothetical protein IJ351_01745 [Oscillospiraceae bacterium]|nr:hypothetical protein [Oscillospiraceae bacterium]